VNHNCAVICTVLLAGTLKMLGFVNTVYAYVVVVNIWTIMDKEPVVQGPLLTSSNGVMLKSGLLTSLLIELYPLFFDHNLKVKKIKCETRY